MRSFIATPVPSTPMGGIVPSVPVLMTIAAMFFWGFLAVILIEELKPA